MFERSAFNVCFVSLGAPGVLGIWKNGYLFSWSWGALVIIFRELGSKLIVLGI